MELVLADSLQEEDEDEESIASSLVFIFVSAMLVSSPQILLTGVVLILVGSSPSKSHR